MQEAEHLGIYERGLERWLHKQEHLLAEDPDSVSSIHMGRTATPD